MMNFHKGKPKTIQELKLKVEQTKYEKMDSIHIMWISIFKYSCIFLTVILVLIAINELIDDSHVRHIEYSLHKFDVLHVQKTITKTNIVHKTFIDTVYIDKKTKKVIKIVKAVKPKPILKTKGYTPAAFERAVDINTKRNAIGCLISSSHNTMALPSGNKIVYKCNDCNKIF